MVEAKVLTRSQMTRLVQESGEANRKFQIPGYQMLQKLGKGSMGVVYKAKQLSVDRVVAIKILLDPLAQNKEFIKRFEREAKIAAKLSHNNVVNAIDAGEIDGHYYFVMEYVEGPTIKDFLDKNKTFDEKEALRITLAIAEALKHAAQRGLIHRDIKPENVILTKQGEVKLADLGLARLTDDEKWGLSEAGMAIGTPYYISPEQVRGQTNIDIRADIYSLGATLYHMVTGKVPYGGETPNEVMRKHVDPNVALGPARPSQFQALRRPGHGRRDDDGQESRAPLPDPRRPDPRHQVPATGREPDDRRPEARDAARPGRGRVRRRAPSRRQRGGAGRARLLRQQSQPHDRHDGDAPGRLGDHQPDSRSSCVDDQTRDSVLAEVEGTDRVFSQRIFHELVMARPDRDRTETPCAARWRGLR